MALWLLDEFDLCFVNLETVSQQSLLNRLNG